MGLIDNSNAINLQHIDKQTKATNEKLDQVNKNLERLIRAIEALAKTKR